MAQDNSDIMLTVLLRHDQSKPLAELSKAQREQGLFSKLPPEGVELVSWHVLMGLGHAVTMRLPASRLREVNLAIEGAAWGPFRTEIYATYDLKDTVTRLREEALATKP